MKLLSEDTMFRGKNLPQFFREYQEQYRMLVELFGKEKILQVYRWLFKYLSGMHFGQWMVLDKVCPNLSHRDLFFYCFEMIYESDLFSQFAFSHDGDVVKIEMLAPTDEQRERWKDIVPNDHYILIDWYTRLLEDPMCDPSIRPEWLMLTVNDNENENENNNNDNENNYESQN